MIPLPLVYALLVALEVAAPIDSDVRMDVLSDGDLEYEVHMLRDETGWRAETIPGGAAPDEVAGSGDEGSDAPSQEARLLFEVERSTRYGRFHVVFFPDRYPALFDLSSVSGQLLMPDPGERLEITVSPELPQMGSPMDTASSPGIGPSGGMDASPADREGSTAAGGAGTDGPVWTVITRRDGLYLTAPSLGRVIVVRR